MSDPLGLCVDGTGNTPNGWAIASRLKMRKQSRVFPAPDPERNDRRSLANAGATVGKNKSVFLKHTEK